MQDDLQNDSAVADQDDAGVVADDNLDLETAELDEEENAYLVNDDEISEGFQFQS